MSVIGIVALEPSADILGATLMQAMLAINPNVQFIGVGGPRMAAIGFKSLHAFSKLSHMGFVEVLKHLPQLLLTRRALLSQLLQAKIDVFIGIDAPDFNLYLESRFKRQGVRTVHYVSPSVWAWRAKRIHNIKRSVDLLLTLFPFETQFYEQHAVPARFVGHPLADEIPLEVDSLAARRLLQLDVNKKIIAIFPGSRSAEIKYMSRVFLQAIAYCHQYDRALEFVVALPSEELKEKFLAQCGDLIKHFSVNIRIGQSQAVLAAADVVLVKSGTVTLEALLYKKPMVIAYLASPLSFWIARKLINVSFIGLPNLLAARSLVPEILQEDAKPEVLGEALLAYCNNPQKSMLLQNEYNDIHRQLRRDASKTAAHAIFGLLGNG